MHIRRVFIYKGYMIIINMFDKMARIPRLSLIGHNGMPGKPFVSDQLWQSIHDRHGHVRTIR